MAWPILTHPHVCPAQVNKGGGKVGIDPVLLLLALNG